MQLNAYKIILITSVFAVFTALALAGKLPQEAITSGTGIILGWLGGLFTPTPHEKNADD